MTESAAAKALAEFHGALGQQRGSLDTADFKQVDLRIKLHDEEDQELWQALFNLDSEDGRSPQARLADVAGELADVVYVAYGTAHLLGIPLDSVIAEVHRANMAKFLGGKAVLREDGKVLKPEGWKPADVEAVLAREAAREEARRGDSEYRYFQVTDDSDYVWRYKTGSPVGEVACWNDVAWDPAYVTLSSWPEEEEVQEADLPAWVVR